MFDLSDDLAAIFDAEGLAVTAQYLPVEGASREVRLIRRPGPDLVLAGHRRVPTGDAVFLMRVSDVPGGLWRGDRFDVSGQAFDVTSDAEIDVTGCLLTVQVQPC